ncbi:OmpA family protein [Noviherbaspirillum cavernae]|uniref:OmpA family protein n=1 Tax=Noviherbaspirillum cavernae TaxID=2320862 RepID=A0A418WYD7_9BURK|nr:OmpA family protein [Noviherbaspirillum cavernae]RJG05237.1 OmpA family protein [Noviherbaspirillum cavernae]
MFKNTAVGLILGSIVIGVSAQPVSDIQATSSNNAYAQDDRGVVARSQYGLCWRSGYWTSTDAATGCDGELTPPIAKPIAPTIATSPATLVQASVAPPAPTRCNFAVTLDNDQAFAFDKANLSDAAKKRLDDEMLQKMASCARIEAILVTGHSDRLGSQQYNQKLSEQRANAVASHLKRKGSTEQINTLGAGKTQPVKACADTPNHAELIKCLSPNRRVVIEVRGTAK